MATIVAVDDTPYNLDILHKSLSAEGYDVLIAESGQKGLDLVDKHNPDLVLLDISMPVMDGHEVLKRLRASTRFHDLPVIMLTADSLDDTIAKCLEAGANDYVTKPFSLKVLSARIMATLRDTRIRDRRESDAALGSEGTTIERLTGIYDRDTFIKQSRAELLRGLEAKKLMALTSIEIDAFDALRDSVGREVADDVLRDFAALLKITFRKSDLVGHVAGERFAVCLPNTRSFQALGVIERLRKALHETSWLTVSVASRERITASIGVAMLSGHKTIEALIQDAETAQKRAKARGRDQIILAPARDV